MQQDKIVEEEILERSIKQRASQILSGSKLSKKIKDLDQGVELNFENINKLNINEIFKISSGNSTKDKTLDQLKANIIKLNRI